MSSAAQEQFENRQAILCLGMFVVGSLIDAGLIDRRRSVSAFEEMAEMMGNRCREWGGDGRPNPTLMELSSGLQSTGPFNPRIIPGGKVNAPRDT
jgi:hypothetical protein